MLLFAAAGAFATGTLIGLVSNWIDSLRYLVLGGLALALVSWLVYWADKLSRRGAQHPGPRTPISGPAVASGAVLVAALGLSATGAATAALVLVGTLVAVNRFRARGRQGPRYSGPAGPGGPVEPADRWRTGPRS